MCISGFLNTSKNMYSEKIFSGILYRSHIIIILLTGKKIGNLLSSKHIRNRKWSNTQNWNLRERRCSGTRVDTSSKISLLVILTTNIYIFQSKILVNSKTDRTFSQIQIEVICGKRSLLLCSKSIFSFRSQT